MKIGLLFGLAFALQPAPLAAASDTNTTAAQNVILIVADGLRWQEVFRGADADMMTTKNLVENPDITRHEYDAETTESRRQKLMPFLWSHVAAKGPGQGVIFGNRDLGSVARVSNKQWFSYPGYNELLTGAADDARITSNRKIPNPNVTVFEWLHNKPEFHDKVAAFGAWDVFPYIFNSSRCGFPVDGGDKAFTPSTGVTPGMELINKIRVTTPQRWKVATFDSLVFPMATEYIKSQEPRAVFLCLGETDEWGHEGHYDNYLVAVKRLDSWLKELWELTETLPGYRGKTTFILTADHGRGDSRQDDKAWNSHGLKYEHSDAIFAAIWGAGVKQQGEIENGPEVIQAQVAATVAQALGYDYNAEMTGAAPAIDAFIKGKSGRHQ